VPSLVQPLSLRSASLLVQPQPARINYRRNAFDSDVDSAHISVHHTDVATVHIDAGAVLMPPFGPSRRLAVAFARLPREVAHAFAEGTDGQR
jgi:hypothetical protein